MIARSRSCSHIPFQKVRLMKSLSSTVLIAGCAFTVLCTVYLSSMTPEAVQAGTLKAETMTKPSVYRHFVLFKFAESATAEQVQSVCEAFAKMPEKIDTIKGYETGINISPENKNKGFTHGFLLTFDDQAGLETYLPHPDHKAFGASLKGLIDDVLVFDYVSP